MEHAELKRYYFPSKQIKKISNKYFGRLIDHIGLDNLILKNISSQDDIVKIQDNIECIIKEFLKNNNTIYFEISKAYHLNSYIFLSEIILQSLYAKLYLEGSINFNIFLSKQSVLYFENEYPENIKDWQKYKNITILDNCRFYQLITNSLVQ